MNKSYKVFTLMELLVVVAIIGILVSLLLPSLEKARYESRIAVCASNIKQNAVGVMLYTNDNAGSFPKVQELYQKAPYATRVAKWSKFGEWYNLGVIYNQNYLSSASTFFCPQHEANGNTKYTYSHNTKNDEFDINEDDFFIRVSYNLLLKEMTTQERLNLKVPQLDSDDLLLNSQVLEKDVVAHNSYRPGWNVMKADMSVKFKYSKEVMSYLESCEKNANWDWSLASLIREELIK